MSDGRVVISSSSISPPKDPNEEKLRQLIYWFDAGNRFPTYEHLRNRVKSDPRGTLSEHLNNNLANKDQLIKDAFKAGYLMQIGALPKNIKYSSPDFQKIQSDYNLFVKFIENPEKFDINAPPAPGAPSTLGGKSRKHRKGGKNPSKRKTNKNGIIRSRKSRY